MPINPESFESKDIQFPNGKSARLFSLKEAMDGITIQTALNFDKSQAVIILAGNTKPFSSRLENRLTDLLSRGVAQAAAECDAILIDDGMNSGVSQIAGQGMANRIQKTRLVGILPCEKVSGPEGTAIEKKLEPNHTHFILNAQERPGWQAETISCLAQTFSCNADWIVTVLVGGEPKGIARDLVLQTVRRKWNLVVIEGSGSLADDIARLKKAKLAWEKRKGILWDLIRERPFFNQLRETDPYLYEIISDGKISIIEKKAQAAELRGRIKDFFTHPPEESLLRNAWQKFAVYDQNSKRHRILWHQLKKAPLYLSVLSTLMVLVYSASGAIPSITGGSTSDLWMTWYTGIMTWLAGIQNSAGWNLFFRFTIILLPITVTIIIAIETRLKPGSKYILLRGAAEAVKRGIYSYRVLKEPLKGKDVNEKEFLLPHDEKTLNDHLEKVSKFLLESDVKESAFTPYEGRIPPEMYAAGDNGLETLTPEQYLDIRVGDQIKFYSDRTNQYEKQIRGLRYWMIVLGGVGTFLAAIGAQYWLPLTAAIVSAATAFLEYQQLEQILTKYNLTKASLENTRARWLSLDENGRKAYVTTMVRDVEAILESENQGWVQYVNQVQKGKEAENQTSSNGANQPNGNP